MWSTQPTLRVDLQQQNCRQFHTTLQLCRGRSLYKFASIILIWIHFFWHQNDRTKPSKGLLLGYREPPPKLFKPRVLWYQPIRRWHGTACMTVGCGLCVAVDHFNVDVSPRGCIPKWHLLPPPKYGPLVDGNLPSNLKRWSLHMELLWCLPFSPRLHIPDCSLLDPMKVSP